MQTTQSNLDFRSALSAYQRAYRCTLRAYSRNETESREVNKDLATRSYATAAYFAKRANEGMGLSRIEGEC